MENFLENDHFRRLRRLAVYVTIVVRDRGCVNIPCSVTCPVLFVLELVACSRMCVRSSPRVLHFQAFASNNVLSNYRARD
jgi:hypothetical protein